MSDDMEREINERSIARKLEEEEMKRKLTGIGIYDPGYSYTEMKELLEFVNDSQNTANITSDNKSVQERTQHSDNECLSDIISNINTQQKVASQECSEMPRPSYSYKNRMSPITHESKTVHYINSPECPVLFEARNSMHRHNSSDSDEIFEKPYDNTNSTHIMTRYGSLKSGTEKRMAQGAQDEIMQKLERWRLNPLDISIDKNDVPLKQPSRPLAQERAPFKHCKNIHKSDQCDRIICCMSQHLKDMADLWCDWRRPNINTIFQWGSPIQVDAANGSLDKKLLTDTKTEPSTAKCIYRDGYERVSKRKANTLITNSYRDSSTEDEDESRHDFVRVKKKPQLNHKSSNAACVTNHSQKTASNAVHSSSNDNIDIDIDNECVKYLSQKQINERDENVEENEMKKFVGRISPELTAHSKMITPLNPKMRLNLAKQKRGTGMSKLNVKTQHVNENKVIKQIKNKKENNTMTEEEIRKLTEDWNDDEEENVTIEINKIQPAPIPREIQYKLKKKQLSLYKTTKKMKTAVEEDESDEENQKKRLKFYEQCKEKELRKIENRNGSREHRLLSDNETKSSKIDQESNVQNDALPDYASILIKDVSCPICNKLFSHNEIENHAADCEQFETCRKEDNNEDMDELECNVCGKFKTNIGVKYEEHVRLCIKNRNDQKHLYGSADTDTTSTSLFRNFIPISQQKHSEIDYLQQFPSNNTKDGHSNKKRKR